MWKCYFETKSILHYPQFLQKYSNSAVADILFVFILLKDLNKTRQFENRIKMGINFVMMELRAPC